MTKLKPKYRNVFNAFRFAKEGQTTFYEGHNSAVLLCTRASKIFITRGLFLEDTLELMRKQGVELIECSDPRMDFIKLLKRCIETVVPSYYTKSELDIMIKRGHIGPNVIVERGAKLGENVVLYGNNYINSSVTIGNNVVIGAGTSIGGPGTGYFDNKKGKKELFPQVAGVVIGDDVETGMNCAIDRGCLSDTIIGNNCKFDNLVHVAHNVVIGENTMLLVNVTFCGSVTVGKNVWLAPGTIIREGLTIGDGASSGLGAVIVKNVPENVLVVGVPAKIMEKK